MDAGRLDAADAGRSRLGLALDVQGDERLSELHQGSTVGGVLRPAVQHEKIEIGASEGRFVHAAVGVEVLQQRLAAQQFVRKRQATANFFGNSVRHSAS
jgi:hypothetical protein